MRINMNAVEIPIQTNIRYGTKRIDTGWTEKEMRVVAVVAEQLCITLLLIYNTNIRHNFVDANKICPFYAAWQIQKSTSSPSEHLFWFDLISKERIDALLIYLFIYRVCALNLESHLVHILCHVVSNLKFNNIRTSNNSNNSKYAIDGKTHKHTEKMQHLLIHLFVEFAFIAQLS